MFDLFTGIGSARNMKLKAKATLLYPIRESISYCALTRLYFELIANLLPIYLKAHALAQT